MKIIKEGTPQPRADTPQNFKCKQCGCEFVAEKGEYDTYMNFYDFRTRTGTGGLGEGLFSPQNLR